MNAINNVRSEFGKKLKYYRYINNITQEDLAQIVGSTRKKICWLEIGKRKLNIEFIIILAKKTNTSVLYWLDEEYIK